MAYIDQYMDRLSEEEVRLKYKHFTQRKFPFEDTIVDVFASDKVPFFERWRFLKSIYLITSKGYYIKYEDICGPHSHCDMGTQPYDVFLEGVIKCAYCYAFNSEIEHTLIYIKKLLSVGKIAAFTYNRGNPKYEGHYCFKFTLPGYSWITMDNIDN